MLNKLPPPQLCCCSSTWQLTTAAAAMLKQDMLFSARSVRCLHHTSRKQLPGPRAHLILL
jgi:hypothetical protein